MIKALFILLFTIALYLPDSKACIARAVKEITCIPIKAELVTKLTPYQKCDITAPELTGKTENKCTSELPSWFTKLTHSTTIAKCVLRHSSELVPAYKSDCTEMCKELQLASCTEKAQCKAFEDCLRDYRVLLECVKITEKDILTDFQPRILGLLIIKSTIPTVKKTLFKMSSNITIFRAPNNQIEAIENDAFQDLKNLSVVDVSYNKIKRINPDIFKNCPKIRVFYANGNGELVIPENEPFLNSPKLETLHLQQCNIEKLSASNFKNLQGLFRLSLAKNNIKVLPGDVFRPLTNLWWLDLFENKLKTISLSVFAPLKPSLMVLMANNPWECDCGLYPVMEYFKSKGYYADEPFCVRPSYKKWREVVLNCPK